MNTASLSYRAAELARLWIDVAQAFGPASAPSIVRALRTAMSRPGSVTLRLPGEAAPIELRGNTSDAATFIQIFLRGDLDFPLSEVPQTIIDVGANIGLASRALARRYPAARIVAVEFEPENFAQLLRNTAGLPQVQCVHAALWPRDGTIAVANPHAAKWAHRPQASEASDGAAIRAVSATTLMNELAIDRVDLLKIDIEGSEYELFGEPAPWLDRVGTLAIELHDRLRPGAGARVLSALCPHQPAIECHGEYLVCRMAGATALAQAA